MSPTVLKVFRWLTSANAGGMTTRIGLVAVTCLLVVASAQPALGATKPTDQPATPIPTATPPASRKDAGPGQAAATPTPSPAPTPGLTPRAAPIAGTDAPACPSPARLGTVRCHALIRTDQFARSAVPVPAGQNVSPAVLGIGGAYDPTYLQSAYNLSSLTPPSGATVAIVDAYDDPSAETDLAYYRSYWGLPACSSGTGCFRKVNQTGGTSYPSPNAGWSQEISLDVDMVSAICPGCKILLVEANSATTGDMFAAIDYAASVPGVVAISLSWGSSSEFSTDPSWNSHLNRPGIAITASTGDYGYGVSYPAASPYVTAVGGTNLQQATNTGTRNATETAWSGAGSGCSAYQPKPEWQQDTGCSTRSVGDVSAVADPNTPVWVRYSGAWYMAGGTSASAPIVASVYALAGAPSSTSPTASYAYANTSALNDVTSGSNGSCSPSYLCTAGSGFDGPTGMGTPNGTSAFAAPPLTGNVHTLSNPSRLVDTRPGSGYQGGGQTLQPGQTACYSVGGQGGVPSNATGAVLNVTAANFAGAGWVRLYPAGQSPPATSTLNYAPGETAIANGQVVGLGTNGQVCAQSLVTTDVILDASGYLAATGMKAQGLTNPMRLVDTRPGSGYQGGGQTLQPGQTACYSVGGQGGTASWIPGWATGAVLNVTVTNFAGAGWVRLYPAGQSPPATSTLNYAPGETAIANGQVVGLGTNGQVCAQALLTTDLVLDATGYLTTTGALVQTLTNPARLVDTRVGSGYQGGGQTLQPGQTACYSVGGQGGVPSNATGAVLNVTAANFAGAGWVRLYPAGQSPPATSTLNYAPGEGAIANGQIVRLGTNGQVCVQSLVATDVILDATGYLQ